jgi:hypothetical protein
MFYLLSSSLIISSSFSSSSFLLLLDDDSIVDEKDVERHKVRTRERAGEREEKSDGEATGGKRTLEEEKKRVQHSRARSRPATLAP